MSAEPTPTHYPQCPYCNAEWSGKGYYVCGTFNNSGCHDTFPQSVLCKDRAAHAATKRELEENLVVFRAWTKAFGTTQLTHALARLESAESRANKADARVAELVGLLKSFKQIFRRQMVGDDPLGAKCVFCSYNGPGYWQPGTHSKSCPWHSVGGMDERRKKLSCLTLGQAMPVQKGGQS